MRSLRNFATAAVAVGMMAFGASSAMADTVRLRVGPDTIPDENTPQIVNDAPTNFGPDSWQNSTIGKVNWHARYGADGDYLTTLFGAATASTLKISDIKSISYNTNREAGAEANEDWSFYIYTRPVSSGWYNNRFINNFDEHGMGTGEWQNWSTDVGMTFDTVGGSNRRSLTALQADHGDELVEMFSIQTHSNFSGFEGLMDGIRIELHNGQVGILDFSGMPGVTVVPTPSAALAGFGLMGITALRRRRSL